MQEIPPFQHIDWRPPRIHPLEGSAFECYISGPETVKRPMQP